MEKLTFKGRFLLHLTANVNYTAVIYRQMEIWEQVSQSLETSNISNIS